MKTSLLRWWPLLLLLAACQNKNTVSLLDTSARDEVPVLGNFTFTFDKDLAPDSMLDKWLEVAYVAFEPNIPGKFRWSSNSELVFSPFAPLPPATRFSATLQKELLKHSKYSLGNVPELSFHTPLESLQNFSAIWDVRNNTDVAIRLQCDFMYIENPAALKPLMKVKLDGREVSFNITSTEASQQLVVDVLNVKAEDRPYQVELTIAKGVLPAGGAMPTEAELTATATLESPLVLTISDVEANHDGLQGVVKIRSSQRIVSQELASFITVSPAVNFRATATDEGLEIVSDEFNAKSAYTLQLKPGLTGIIGGVLKSDYSSAISFGELEPSIGFESSDAMYLSGKGAKNILARIVGVKKVKLVVSKIYENNLLPAMRYGYYVSNYDEYYGEGSDYEVQESLGDIVYEKELDVSKLKVRGNSRLLQLDLKDKLPDYWGIYHVSIRSMEDYWVSDSRFVSMSDIGLIAKLSSDRLYVFTNSVQTAESLPNVIINVYGANNQIIGTGSSGGDGMAEIAYKKKDFKNFTPAMITARSGNDFSFLPFNRTRVETSRFEVGGKVMNTSGLDAFIYAERDLYRPGERMNVSAIVRDYNWKTPAPMPLKLKVLLPNGALLKEFRKTLNEEGSLEAGVELSAAAVTGSYNVQLFTTNNVLLADKSIKVEEFMPDRIRVNVEASKKVAQPGDEIELSINATNLYGTAAAGRKYEVEQQINMKMFSSKRYPKFNFSLSNLNTYFEKNVSEGKTDDNGNASERYTIPANYTNMGVLKADYFTTVFDESGRPVNRVNSVDVFTQPHFYGLQTDGYYWYSVQQPVSFGLIALNASDAPVNTQAHVVVIKREYKTVLTSSYGSYYRYQSQQEDKTVSDQLVNVGGENTVFRFVPKTTGSYLIRVAAPGANSWVEQSFYAYGWGNDFRAFEVNKDGNVEIETDKGNYKTGEAAKVFFKTPFNGRMLVTVETDQVLDHFYLETKNRSASFNLKLTETHLPNVYVSATLIKAHAETDLPLTVAHGFKCVNVEESSRKLAVEIVAPKAVRSHTRQKVKVKAAPNSKITLAAVDEGILQITRHKTPDPYGHYYAARALSVHAFDLYPLLFPEVKGLRSSTGGDGYNLGNRTNPLANKRVKLVSYWSGITDAGGNATADFEFDIPQFSGELRLMAVAYKGNKFGSAEARITVADPVVLTTSLPRFLSPGDTVDMAVNISNTTTKSMQLTAAVKTEGPLTAVEDAAFTQTLAAGKEARFICRLAAAQAVAAAKVKVEVKAAGETFTDETDLTIRPASSLVRLTGSGVLSGGTTATVNMGSGNLLPASVDYYFMIGASPALELGRQISELVRYPHGCTEQTISAAFPQLYFSDLCDLMNRKNDSQKKSASGNVMEAIRKIQMRQLYSGGISLWDAGSEDWWATVYAAHFLLEAKKAGFEFEPSVLEKTLGYLQARLKQKETIEYFYNRNQQKKIAPKEVAYSLFVLALAGKAPAGTMNYYNSNRQLLALDSRFMLAAAYSVAGDKTKLHELLPTSFAGEESVRQSGGSFYSPLRDEAIALYALLQCDRTHPAIPALARQVADGLRQDNYLNTQERSFGLLALGQLARQDAGSIKAEVKANGKTVATCTGSPLLLSARELGSLQLQLSAAGSGRLYYYWETKGIATDGKIKEEDSYLRVRRSYFNRFGQPISGNSFRQNELVVVCLTVESAYNSRPVENVVITDLLPAGFEIENPRISEVPGMDWVKNAREPAHSDLRDDRIHFFDQVGAQPQRYYYAVRCVTPGTYRQGPASADAMYQGQIHSYHGAGVLRVQ